MIIPSAPYTAANNATYKSPVYAVLIEGITDCFVFTSGVFLNSYTAGTVRKTGKTISGISRKVSLEHGFSTTSSMTLTILDTDSHTITSQLSKLTPYLDGSPRQIKIFAGYDTVNFGDMVSTGDALQIYTGMIKKVHLPKVRGPYNIEIQDAQQIFAKDLFTDAVALVAPALPTLLTGIPYDLILKILTSTGAGTNGVYDVLPVTWGLAIPQSMIDIATFEYERSIWYGTNEVSIAITDRVMAKEFLEKELLKVVSAHLIMKGNGQISIKSMRPIIGSTAGLPTITNDSIVGDILYNRNIEGVINDVTFQYDYDPYTNDFLKRSRFVDSTSLLKYTDAKPLLIQSKGLRGSRSAGIAGFSDLGADAFVEDRATRIFQRMAYPPQEINFTTFFDKHLMEEGDIFLITHPEIPSEQDSMGITDEPMEVISKDVDWQNGRVKWTSLDYFPNSNAKYALFGPTTLLSYELESTANKNTYAFFSRWDGTMKDGTIGYNFL